MNVTAKYLREHPHHIFVFGDNTLRKGFGGAASLRNEPNTYGFITKRYPSLEDDAYFRPNGEYRRIFLMELWKLQGLIEERPAALSQVKLWLISKLGAGLANKYGIWEKVIEPGIQCLREYDNVIFLWEV